MKRHQFQCFECQRIFDKDSEEEAAKELKENFGEAWKPEDCEVLCDDCYDEFMQTFKKEIN